MLNDNNNKDMNKDIIKGKTLRGLPYAERVRAYMSARNRNFGGQELD